MTLALTGRVSKGPILTGLLLDSDDARPKFTALFIRIHAMLFGLQGCVESIATVANETDDRTDSIRLRRTATRLLTC